MAATRTVAQRPPLRKSGKTFKYSNKPEIARSIISPRNGVVVLSGYGISLRVERAHLLVDDGIADERRQGRFARVGHGLERLVVIGSEGVVSLAALRWLSDQKASLFFVERDGSVITVAGPTSPSDARLRRAQASLADSSGAGLVIARELISRKLAGQERLVRNAFHDLATADAIAECGSKLANARSVEDVRLEEAHAARIYFGAWANEPVTFPKADLARVPAHWRMFGTRHSPLTGSPRRAVSPPNTMLNFLFSIVAAEARLAIVAMGLDPGFGVLHVTGKTRDSLVFDIIEPVRTEVEAFVLNWIRRVTLKRDWFFEMRDGTCRLDASFAEQLATTARMWRSAVAPWAEWLAQTLWSSVAKSTNDPGPGTRLTHGRRRVAKGSSILPPPERAVQPQGVCQTCGTALEPGLKYCRTCFPAANVERLINVAPAGWIATQRPSAQALRAESMRRHQTSKAAWDASTHPKWLTEEVYRQKILPLLKSISTSRVSTTLGLTWAYAANLRRGERIPHKMHWLKLSELVGVKENHS